MRQFDFSPLYRATVGFDQIADMFDRVLTSDNQTSSYPPYNIEKIDEDAYRISVAVAGFSEADLNVEVRHRALRAATRAPTLDTNAKPRRVRTPCGDTRIECEKPSRDLINQVDCTTQPTRASSTACRDAGAHT